MRYTVRFILMVLATLVAVGTIPAVALSGGGGSANDPSLVRMSCSKVRFVDTRSSPSDILNLTLVVSNKKEPGTITYSGASDVSQRWQKTLAVPSWARQTFVIIESTNGSRRVYKYELPPCKGVNRKIGAPAQGPFELPSDITLAELQRGFGDPVMKNVVLPAIQGKPEVGSKLSFKIGSWRPTISAGLLTWFVYSGGKFTVVKSGGYLTVKKSMKGKNVLLGVLGCGRDSQCEWVVTRPVKVS